MASWLTGWNPIVSFPQYHGPYAVGTVDVEIPAADLPAPSAAPEDAQPTIAFRIFYPCEKPSSSELHRPVRWIPQPQRATISAFAKFIGVKSPRLASAISLVPQQLYWIALPAHRNAQLLDPPTSNGRWPVTIFSHGLAGSRNAYSYVCGDLASQGMIVIALDHRDGSSPIQYVRATATTAAHVVNPVKISHEPSAEVYEGRDKQLRIRMWEISMAYEALLKIDAGQEIENLDINASKRRRERVEVLWQFEDMLDIHRAGKVTWAGHSFGAATTVQLLKSFYYHKERPEDAGRPLIIPNADAAILHQIMPESPVLLLDMWCLPLRSPDQQFLWDKPLPSYAVGGPGGDNVLSVLSEAFHNWEDNLNINKHIVSAPSLSRRPSNAPRLTRERGRLLPEWARLRDDSPASISRDRDSGYASETSRSPLPSLKRHASRTSWTTTAPSILRGRNPSLSPSTSSPSPSTQPSPSESALSSSTSAPPPKRSEGPHMFFCQRSQHFNQSDFGLLFPWIAQRVTKAEEPAHILHLNNRAMVQIIREAGIEMYGPDDRAILDRRADRPEHEKVWRWIPVPLAPADAHDPHLAPDGDAPATPGIRVDVASVAAVDVLRRKLSASAARPGSSATHLRPQIYQPPPRDGMTMGQKVAIQQAA